MPASKDSWIHHLRAGAGDEVEVGDVIGQGHYAGRGYRRIVADAYGEVGLSQLKRRRR
ncbi:MAG: hypothetical protein IPM59_08770 [Chloracidobacterium sp.]|nr:hypothetical protein [Chloracidobacterium sp.]